MELPGVACAISIGAYGPEPGKTSKCKSIVNNSDLNSLHEGRSVKMKRARQTQQLIDKAMPLYVFLNLHGDV
jgi:hypothetical protein